MKRPTPSQLRTIKLGKLGKNFPTTPSNVLGRQKAHAVPSWESFSQLPLNKFAAVLSFTLWPVGKELCHKRVPNLKFYNVIRLMHEVLSCGGETPILRMGRTLKGVPPTSGWGSPCARGPPKLSPRTSRNRVGRQRPELAFTEPLSSATTMASERHHHDDRNIQQL